MNKKEKEPVYDASQIQVLKGLEAVRLRPAMYIGDVSVRGLHHLVNEVVDNSVDEALAGYCTEIDVSINKDGSVTVEDDGRGIPVDLHPEEKKSALEVVMTVLHAGGKFDKKAYKVSGGLHGVGVSVVNALSEWMVVEVARGGKVYRQRYEKGFPVTPVKIVGQRKATGTKTTFLPDATIFKKRKFSFEIIVERLRELAFLNKDIKFHHRQEHQQVGEIQIQGRSAAFVEYLIRTAPPKRSSTFRRTTAFRWRRRWRTTIPTTTTFIPTSTFTRSRAARMRWALKGVDPHAQQLCGEER